jgi:hypothetical protein
MKFASTIQVEKHFLWSSWHLPTQLTVNLNITLSTTPRNKSDFILSGLINITCVIFHLRSRGMIYPTRLNLLDLITHFIFCETYKQQSYLIWSFAQFCDSIFLSGQNVPNTSLIYTSYGMNYMARRVVTSYSWLNRLYGAENETDGEESCQNTLPTFTWEE